MSAYTQSIVYTLYVYDAYQEATVGSLIPALIAYIKVVAVKKLVVGCRARASCRPLVGRQARVFLPEEPGCFNELPVDAGRLL